MVHCWPHAAALVENYEPTPQGPARAIQVGLTQDGLGSTGQPLRHAACQPSWHVKRLQDPCPQPSAEARSSPHHPRTCWYHSGAPFLLLGSYPNLVTTMETIQYMQPVARAETEQATPTTQRPSCPLLSHQPQQWMLWGIARASNQRPTRHPQSLREMGVEVLFGSRLPPHVHVHILPGNQETIHTLRAKRNSGHHHESRGSRDCFQVWCHQLAIPRGHAGDRQQQFAQHVQL
mmetsp:Transcript_75620/g.146172  ORF Transcript_75620/g.146172 Transcript_75620/m.146172 type:complete len:233 (-) Transcript_75620:268-966(-)